MIFLLIITLLILLYNLFSVDTNQERNLYRIYILFSNPNKILFKSINKSAAVIPTLKLETKLRIVSCCIKELLI